MTIVRIKIKTMLMMALVLNAFTACKPKGPADVSIGDAASKVYLAPGMHYEFYIIGSCGFNGHIGVDGFRSGSLF
ncbi:MAG: nitrous oxide reductase, partial [Cyclobacteriaceae bacterium]|nr:nitrous oxide reductase [Cyclobacteriaceae bacterium]